MILQPARATQRRRRVETLYQSNPNGTALAIPLSTNSTLSVLLPPIPIAHDEVIEIYNASGQVIASSAADARFVVCDGMAVTAAFLDAAGTFMGFIQLAANPWQQGSLISQPNGLSIAADGDPLMRLYGNMTIAPFLGALGVIRSVQFGLNMDFRNTDAAGAHTILAFFTILVAPSLLDD